VNRADISLEAGHFASSCHLVSPFTMFPFTQVHTSEVFQQKMKKKKKKKKKKKDAEPEFWLITVTSH
jgi:hypothetical protein